MNVSEVAGEIARLDQEIEQLQDQRSDITDRLEKLAHVWHERYPESHTRQPRTAWSRLRCTACRFRFIDILNEEVRFGTDCIYCGQDEGAGVYIPAAWFERQELKEESVR